MIYVRITKRVDGVNNKNTVINNLDKFTAYDVAIQAATSKGAGSHGRIENATTLEDGRYCQCV